MTELRRLRWALPLIAGLVGALAVHVIFCQTFLPGITSDPGSAKTITAFSAALGGLVFLVLAAPNLRVGGRPREAGPATGLSNADP